jgi:hypothetical protein
MFFGSTVGLIGGLVLLAILILPAFVITLDDRMWGRHKVQH